MVKYVIGTVLLCFFLQQLVFGQEAKEEIEALKEAALKEIDYASKILDETRGEREASLNDLSIIGHLLEQRREYVRGLENEAHEITLAIEENNSGIGLMEREIDRIKEDYAKMVISAYKNRRKNYMLMYFLASENMNQAYKRIRYFKMYNDYQRRQTDQLTELSEEMAKKNEVLMEMYREKDSIIKVTNSENNKIKEEAEEKNMMIASLNRREKELMTEIREKEEIARRLERELAAIIEEEKRRTNNTLLIATLTPEERLISDEFGRNKGMLPWPTEQGIVTGRFGEHDHPEYKSIKVRNEGVYISTVAGTEVRAIFNGRVSKIFAIPGENPTVIIKHGEYYTVYHNLTDVRVVQGQEVVTKQLIGNIYTDSNTKESVLYFQVWKDIERNDPEEWLSH